MMKVTKCMENDSMHKKVGMPQVSQLTMKVNIGCVMQIASGPKRSQKGKWDKNPPKDKRTLAEKKSQDVAKVRCFNCEKLGHFSKDCKKIRQDWSQGGFITKANVAKLGPNSIMFRFKV